jgi:hypothetical protein
MQQMLIAGGKRDPTAVYVDGATGVTSAALPAHAIGDLILCFAFCDGADTIPSLGAGFTSELTSVSGSGVFGVRIGSQVATVTNTASGTWSNATSVVFVVYRNAALGNNTASQGSGTSVNYPQLVPTVPNGSSVVIAFAGSTVGDSTLQTPPTGMVNRQTVAHAGDEAAAHETSAGSYLWAGGTVSVGGTSANSVVYILEIKSV